jgi:hypothetical protein
MVMTTHGEMDEAFLEKRVVPQVGSDEVKNIVATEYWLAGELVHRSLTCELVGRDLAGVQQPLMGA